MTNVKSEERIIFPLDVPNLVEARKYIRLLRDSVGLFKVGLELFVSEGPAVLQIITEESQAKVFLDMKFHDIPATVRAAQRAASRYNVEFVTVHCDEGKQLLEAMIEGSSEKTKALAVTVLTSLAEQDLRDIGISERFDMTGLVLHRAGLAKNAGCAGVVCSGLEIKAIRKRFGNDLIVVTPGVRPEWARRTILRDDQRRTTTPFEAIVNGADYIVVGRPIRNHPDPVEAARKIADEIEKATKAIST
ncbi:MAG: orotidine-5'-phosphate decarboxylase [Thermodesulfobacteriota bacterium]